jgi:hypothetical protein
MVFDASCWLEEANFLNVWLNENDVEGDFYSMSMEIEKAKEAAAKALLRQRGKEETPKAVERIIDSFDGEDDTESFRDGLCYNFAEKNLVLVEGHNFDYWSRALCEYPDELFDGPVYQDAYEFVREARMNREEDGEDMRKPRSFSPRLGGVLMKCPLRSRKRRMRKRTA